MKEKFVKAYMDVAQRFAELSSARRLHVGAIIVKDDRIISIGYNGMPVGWDNECEHKEYMNAAKAGFMMYEYFRGSSAALISCGLLPRFSIQSSASTMSWVCTLETRCELAK